MQASDRYLADLNPGQREAVTFGIPAGAAPAPPLLVIAGAGTGKTTTLAHRVARLVMHGADPGRILLLTFSRRAADEMRRRVAAILDQAAGDAGRGLEWAGTFHATGRRVLSIYAAQAGLEGGVSVLDRADAADLLDLVRADLDLVGDMRRFPRKATCLQIYSAAVNGVLPLAELLAQRFPWCAEWEAQLKRLFGAYVEAKQHQAALDLDDLLLWWERLMQEPALAAHVGNRFDHVLVDEYQDTNPVQQRILLALKPDGAGVTAVGDDAQAIYSFRGASVRNILDFPKAFVPPAAILALSANYRSTQPILDAAGAVIGLRHEGFAKALEAVRPGGVKPVIALLRDDIAQALYVVRRILENREAGTRLNDQAVLFRTGQHSAALELELTRRGIPFVKWGGLRFLDAAHVKDLLALLRWSRNLKDRVAGMRSLQLLPGIGPGTAKRLMTALEVKGDPASLASIVVPPAARPHWPGFVGMMADLVQDPAWPGDLVRLRDFLEPRLPELYEGGQSRVQDLDQLAALAERHADAEAFLAEMVLDPPELTGDQAGPPSLDEEQLVLSTIHSAKGQEWRSVFVLNCVDGCIPSDLAVGSAADIEEERRLFYVAMTRAKDELELLQPERFFILQQAARGDRHVRAIRTRFIPDRLLRFFTRRNEHPWRGADAPASALPRLDVKADLRRMWAE
ncbi:ATP-dependent helicase [Arboricoccus pini]